MNRPDKLHYYLNIATTVSDRSTCLRRRYGAVIVKNDEIISTGYNGAPRGCTNCIDKNFCKRVSMKVKHNERYELCRAVHAEMNALLSASRSECIGATLYLSCKDDLGYVQGSDCCDICKKLIINAGIETVIIRDNENEQRIYKVKEWSI
jgi:dCMP deaminase